MPTIGVDIVLLLPHDLNELILKLNEELRAHNEPLIVLEKKAGAGAPHLSLCMGAIEQEKLQEAARLLARFGVSFAPLELAATHVDTHVIKSGRVISQFSVGKSPALQRLHERLMREFKALLVPGVPPDKILLEKDEREDPFTRPWIERYEHDAAFAQFKPHITLGIGHARELAAPRIFTTNRIALCALGNFCTCRRIVAEETLRGKN